MALVVILGAAQSPPDAHAAPPFIPTSSGWPTEDTLTKILTQGGAAGVLLVVLWSYRRDFFRRLEDKEAEILRTKMERDNIAALLKDSSNAITNSAVATARQTDATHRLARAVEAFERRE